MLGGVSALSCHRLSDVPGCSGNQKKQNSLFRPEMSLTKICIVSSSLALELMLEMLELRCMMADVVEFAKRVCVRGGAGDEDAGSEYLR